MPKQLKPGMPGYETFRLTGHRFGDLQVIKRDDEKSARGVNWWWVRCRPCTRTFCEMERNLENGSVTCCKNCRALLKFRDTDKS